MAEATRRLTCHIPAVTPTLYTDASEAHALREVLEPAIIEHATGLLHPRLLARLGQEAEHLLDCDLSLAPQVYCQVHMSLYQVAPVPRLVALAEIELRAAAPVLLHYLGNPVHRRTVVKDVRELLAALAKGRTGDAVTVLRRHLTRLSRAWAMA
jgi:DNA-binding GntR family transcriptional regulator